MRYPDVRQIFGALLVVLCVAQPAAAEITDHSRFKSAFYRADKKIKQSVKTSGVAGMKSDIDNCYREFYKSYQESTVIYCYALHRIAGDLDGAFSAVTDLDVQDPALTRDAASIRAVRALRQLGYSDDRSYHKLAAWAFYGYERR